MLVAASNNDKVNCPISPDLRNANLLRIRPAVRLACLSQPFKKALITAASIGAEAVEIDARSELDMRDLSDTAIRHICKLLEDQGLSVSALTFQTRRGYNVHADLDRRVHATKRAMELAYRLGAKVVINRIGRVPEDSSSVEFEMLRDVLTEIGEHSQRVGVVLAARTGAENGTVLAELMSQLPPGCGAVDFDPASLIMNGYSSSEAAQALAPFISHVHIKDGLRDIATGRGEEVAFGSGVVDFDEIFGLLEQQQYQGYFTVDREFSHNPRLEIAETVEHLKRI